MVPMHIQLVTSVLRKVLRRLHFPLEGRRLIQLFQIRRRGPSELREQGSANAGALA